MKLLSHIFFNQEVDKVAKDLLGKVLNFYDLKVIICETESYDESDPASHSYLGKVTKRNKPMFEIGGTIYVYLIYGIHHCFNLVTGSKGVGEAVLIRSIYIPKTNTYINGPGLVCRYLSITKEHNNINTINNSNIYLMDIGLYYPFDITTRIGINKGKNLLRRFVIPKKYITTINSNIKNLYL